MSGELTEIMKKAAIINAAKRGNLKLVESRLAAGDDVEARDDYGYTPLMAASSLSVTRRSRILRALTSTRPSNEPSVEL